MKKNLITITFMILSLHLYSQTGFHKIEKDFNNGILSKEQKLLNKFHFGFNQSQLPVQYRDNVPAKCGTRVIMEYLQNKDKLSKQTVGIIESYLNPVRKTQAQTKYNSPSGIFEINYSTSGANSVPATDNDNSGVPDYVEQIAEYFDYSWTHLIDTLGFDAPPLQNGVYQIDFEDMGFYGYTSTTGGSYTYIVMNTSYVGFPSNTDPEGNEIGAAKVTAYHEFKHALQYGYNQWGSETSNWFIEMDATWSEDIGYDYVNDYYNYLPASQITSPGRSLTNSDGYEDCIFLHYFTEKFDNNLAVKFWASIKENNFSDEFEHLDNVLLNFYSTELSEQMPGYFVWNSMTGNNNFEGATTYEEAENYPTSSLCRSANSFPIELEGCAINAYGSNIISLASNNSEDLFSYEFASSNNGFEIASVFNFKEGSPEVFYFNPSTDGDIFRTDYKMNEIEKVFIIPIVNSQLAEDYQYEINLKPFEKAEFTHSPITDRETDATIEINVLVLTPFNLALTDSLKLNYSEDGINYNSVIMSSTGNQNEYIAILPAMGLEKRIYYYFSIYETSGGYIFHPESAPQEPFTFFVGGDVVFPELAVNPVQLQLSKYNFPYQLSAYTSDNIGIKELYVDYKINKGDVVKSVFSKLGDSLYTGRIDLYAEDLNEEDIIEYRIISVDESSNQNSTSYPATGFESITIVPGFRFQSAPSKFIPDNNFPSVKDTIEITEDITISDFDLYFEGTHNKFSDWDIRVRTPFGQSKILWSRPGLNTDFADAINPKILFDQQALLSVADVQYNDATKAEGVFKPQASGAFDSFNSKSAKGNWIISIFDKATGNEGTIDKWSIILRGEIVTSLENDLTAPTKYHLAQNYPNPFNPTTTITYSIPVVDVRGGVEGPHVSLIVYDLLGREVSMLVNKQQKPGSYRVEFNANGLTSGIYFYKLTAGNFSQTRKMLLVR